MINLLNLIINKTNVYHVNELVSRDHREKFDLNSFEERINRALRSIFGAELDDVFIGDRFYAYKLKRRLATRKEKVQLGRLIVRIIPELIPAIRSYPQRYPEELRTCRRLFQCVKAKKRLAEILALIG
ncbi:MULTISPECIES: hypothetical protein [Aeromonas]|uniref:hypothetical protein n=1 Tax=Aeromonas TaxID=642 RepID=UPI001CF007BC|nr:MULTISPECIES: hypothetical protein [Aeromonas]UCM58420.1 hypothetical protein LEO74_04410 [Aeromonas hydrophila]WEA31100.1 hypothetical protein PWO56_04590 [Aeromonas hydrophila]